MKHSVTIIIFCLLIAAGCDGPTGPQGEQGPQGEPGPQGDPGPPGQVAIQEFVFGPIMFANQTRDSARVLLDLTPDEFESSAVLVYVNGSFDPDNPWWYPVPGNVKQSNNIELEIAIRFHPLDTLTAMWIILVEKVPPGLVAFNMPAIRVIVIPIEAAASMEQAGVDFSSLVEVEAAVAASAGLP